MANFARKFGALAAEFWPVVAFYVAVILIVTFGVLRSPDAKAADTHVCATIVVNAGVVYDKIDAMPNGTDATPLAQALIESKLPTVQVKVLITGMQFLLQNWGHPAINRVRFQEAALAACVSEAGPIEDREHI